MLSATSALRPFDVMILPVRVVAGNIRSRLAVQTTASDFHCTVARQDILCASVRLRSHGHEYESGFPFTGCLSLVQALPTLVEHSRSLVQARTQRVSIDNSSEIKSSGCLAKKVTIFHYIVNNLTNRAPLIVDNLTMT